MSRLCSPLKRSARYMKVTRVSCVKSPDKPYNLGDIYASGSEDDVSVEWNIGTDSRMLGQ